MDTEALQSLINKYYEGETSAQEENTLMQWLENDQSGKFEQEKLQLLYFQGERKKNPVPHVNWQPTNDSKKGRQRYLWIGAVAASIALILAVTVLLDPFSEKVEFRQVSISAEQTNNEVFVLPDNSKIWLNKDSKIDYPASMDENTRIIHLTGEAYFEVEPDPERPFIVKTSHAEVEVLGTAFNVRSYPDESTIEVMVDEGKVAFSTYKKELQEKVFLTAGNEAIFDKKANTITKLQFGDPNHLAWKTKKLFFDNDLIADVLTTVNRAYKVNIYTKYEDLLNCRFKGTLNNASLEDVIALISFSMEWEVEKTERGYQLSGNGCSAN